MSISRLTISNLRNIKHTELNAGQTINVICGDNGAGKTSVLEALHVLAMARGFKATRNKSLIAYGETDLTVFGRTFAEDNCDPHAIGVTRSHDKALKIRIDNNDVKRSAELAEMLPLSLINAQTFELLEGSPKNRRQFLDWGAFHFDASFIQHWQDAQKCIKNRNILLRSATIDRAMLAVWDKALVAAADEVDRIRQAYLAGFVPVFVEIMNKMQVLPKDAPELTLSYRRGWDKSKTLLEVLADQLPRDMKTGYSHAGPQRADISIRLNGFAAHEVLSRGQQKLVVCAMKIAQGYYLSELKKSDFVFLVDDLPSELDDAHQQQLCQLLEDLKAQVFISSIKPLADELWQSPEQVKHFKIENGQVSEMLEKAGSSTPEAGS